MTDMIVTSFFPGRIRLREAVFKDPVIVEECIKILKSSDAVKNIQNNYTTGSVLLEYDPDKIPLEKLKSLIPFFQDLEKLTHGYTIKKRDVAMNKLQEFKDTLINCKEIN